jgi:Lar family restriction alleviation protein
MENELLKPCPFCGKTGGEIESFNIKSAFRVRCRVCFIATGIFEHKESLIEFWNTRNGETVLAENEIPQNFLNYIFEQSFDEFIESRDITRDASELKKVCQAWFKSGIDAVKLIRQEGSRVKK